MTAIQWTERTWNPVVGCSRISPGCVNCYAERQAVRLANMGQERYAGLTNGNLRKPRWTGKVRLVPEALAQPLRRKVPTRWFVNSMSDLFHEGLGDHLIASVFGVMAAAPAHTFQVLTKRAERMTQWFEWLRNHLGICATPALRCAWHAEYWLNPSIAGRGSEATRDVFSRVPWPEDPPGSGWPLPNVWLGVSVEDDEHEERVPYLLDTPAALRWVSAEPLIGRIDLSDFLREQSGDCGCSDCEEGATCEAGRRVWPALDWIVVGGESGPGARPCKLEWIRDIVRQCREAGVPVFVKQLGSVLARELGLRDRKGGDIGEWPEDLRVREYPAPVGAV